MVLKNVAEDISMHESTISRVTTNNTAHAVRHLPPQYFFTTGSPRPERRRGLVADGKDTIQKMVREEDPAAPLRTSRSWTALKARGLDIARGPWRSTVRSSGSRPRACGREWIDEAITNHKSQNKLITTIQI